MSAAPKSQLSRSRALAKIRRMRLRTDETRLRARDGHYVAECKFCECPDGCACDGEGCSCGTSKTVRA